MSFMLPHLHSGWAVDRAIVDEKVKKNLISLKFKFLITQKKNFIYAG